MAYVYKKKKTFGQKMQARASYGDEPSFTPGVPLGAIEQLNAFNWYHKVYGVEEARSYLKTYFRMAKKEEEYYTLDTVPDDRICLTAAWIARMGTRGAKFPASELKWFREKIQEMMQYAVKRTHDPERGTVRDAMLDKANKLIGDVEEILDERDPDFDMYQWLISNEVPGKVAEQILAYYQPLLDELNLCKSGKDPDLAEAYKPLGKRRFFAYYDFVAKLIDDLNKYVGNSKKTRKVRKSRKSKPVDVNKKLKLFKYLEGEDSLKLKSVNPAGIIGSQELWVYNTAQKQLIVYRAQGPGGLDINRSSIVGFDPNTSMGKRVGRNLEQTLNNVLTGGKIVRRKLLDGVKAETIRPTGRINNGTILLLTAR